MTIGVCYFPEHWPRERWESDVRQMAEAGLEYVRMGEFSWAVLEPERGRFDAEWLDEAVRLLGEQGLKAVLCTPTATPPKWLVDDRPEILQRERDGTVREFGSRRHYCFNSDAYRRETGRIVETLADRYADDPHVVGWQTDNEFGCHRTVRCYCDDCATGFRTWLREKYDDIDALNDAWGTTFWSQRHASFDEIDPPGHTPAEHHPSRLLEYYRFASDSVVDYNRLQASLLREANDDWFVTHNFMGHFSTLDAYAVSEELDLVSWDSYPTGFVQDRRAEKATPDELRAGDPDQVSLNHDLYRGALGEPFWVMEQQPGDVNWPPHCPQPGEGAMRLWAHHAVAHGADAVLYFRWRRCLEGQEQYHAGLLKQDGTPDRGYRDAADAAAELAAIGDVGRVDAPVALLHDYDSLWALSEQPHAPDFDYWGLLGAFYAALRARGVQVDVVHPSTDPADYAAVVAPALHLVTDDLATRLAAYVEAGGELLFGPRTGVKDEHNKLRPVVQPGPLSALVGATVGQHESLPARLDARVARVDEGDAFDFRTWAEWLDADAAEPIFEYAAGGVADGRTAVTRNAVADGAAAYCGVWPGRDLADDLARSLLERAGVEHAERLPDGVRVAVRDGHTWVTNFSSRRCVVDAGEAHRLVGDAPVAPFGVAVLEGDVADGLSATLVD
ncbi:beta-galactosidase [Haloferacaceae archaeon DSL9]